MLVASHRPPELRDRSAKDTLLREELFLWIDVVIPATEPGDWQLLKKPLGVMSGRFFLTREG